MGRQLIGRVTGFDQGFFQVRCENAPDYLKDLNLRPWQMGGAAVGNLVALEYQVTARSGLWNVVAVEGMSS